MNLNLLTEGDVAPLFELHSTQGGLVRLSNVLTRSPAVLFFYLRAFTPVCMAEVCGFRDAAEEFRDLNGALFGISADSSETAQRFAGFHKLPYPLLLDSRNRVRDLYRVPKLFGILPGRSTFVVGQNGRILSVTHAAFESGAHISQSLQALRSEEKA